MFDQVFGNTLQCTTFYLRTPDKKELPEVLERHALWGWGDADWAGDTNTHQSHTGYMKM